MPADDDPTLPHLARAFDELRFGATRTLNLRALQPTAMQASAMAEQWLRSKQMEGPGEALIVTGRGNRSIDGYSPVRESIVKLLPSLRRRNVIQAYAEHTPGSFVIEFAPVRALFEVPKRRRENTLPTPASTPAALIALDPETLDIMRQLAVIALAALGIVSPTGLMIEDEMCRQFAQLSAAIGSVGQREQALRNAAKRALEEFELG